GPPAAADSATPAPPRRPGSWEGLGAYAADQRGAVAAGHALGRRPEIDERYRRYFRWAAERGQAGWQYLVQTAQWRCEHGGPWVALEPNIVPYDLEPGVEHWNLWYHPATTPGSAELDMGVVLRHVRLFLPALEDGEVVLFQNIPEFRSVPEVAHAHVFVRPRGSSTAEELCELRKAWRLRSPWAEHERLGGRGAEVGF
ncbi:unnamed protein product, partial [Prorocentrum cordatum]